MQVNDVVLATWGIGPSFRHRVIENIKAHQQMTSDKKMKYVIMTDLVSDFDEIRNTTDLILEVVDIFELIEKWNITLVNEFIPQSRVEPEYAIEFQSKVGHFSYNAKRFILLRLYELNITRFMMIDPDVYLKYPTQESLLNYLTVLDIPTQSLAGIHNETVKITSQVDSQGNAGGFINATRCYGQETIRFVHHVQYLLYRIGVEFQKRYNKYHNYSPRNFTQFEFNEGPFRYYNFESSEHLLDYFYAWNLAREIIASDSSTFSLLAGPGYMHSDFASVVLANTFLNINVIEFPRHLIDVHVFNEDRYFCPRAAGLQKTTTMKEFYKINQDLINDLKQKNSWTLVN
jgi:hypothetical protein